MYPYRLGTLERLCSVKIFSIYIKILKFGFAQPKIDVILRVSSQ